MKLLITVALSIITITFTAQSVVGKWKTIDDETGNPKSIVEIVEKDGKLFGNIIELINPTEKDPICDKCEGDRKDQKVTGLEIIRDMEPDGSDWDEGTIVDPASGEVYDCKLWIDEDDSNKLQVRGYVLFFYRTQTWIRVN